MVDHKAAMVVSGADLNHGQSTTVSSILRKSATGRISSTSIRESMKNRSFHDR